MSNDKPDYILDNAWARIAEFDEKLSREDYERKVDVAFPYSIAQEFQTAGVSTPMREFLTWLAERNPEDAWKLLGIRDAYYSGDHDDDYGDQISEPNNTPLSTEERALLRAERRADQAARNEQRHAIERGFEEETERQAKLWAPYRAQLQRLDLQLSRLNARRDQLDVEWDAILIAREDRETERSIREANEKARLAEIEQAIGADQTTWRNTMSELRELVYATAHKKAA